MDHSITSPPYDALSAYPIGALAVVVAYAWAWTWSAGRRHVALAAHVVVTRRLLWERR